MTKSLIIATVAAVAVAAAALPGINAVLDTAGPKFSDKPRIEVKILPKIFTAESMAEAIR